MASILNKKSFHSRGLNGKQTFYQAFLYLHRVFLSRLFRGSKEQNRPAFKILNRLSES
jgi:hypothetical protein